MLAMLLHMPHMVARLVRGHVPTVLLVHRDAMKTMPLGVVLGLLDRYDLGLRRGPGMPNDPPVSNPVPL